MMNDKLNIVYTYKGVLLSIKKEISITPITIMNPEGIKLSKIS